MFLADLLSAPTVGAIELSDDRITLLNAHLVDTVFIAVECKQRTGGTIALGTHGIKDGVGEQCDKIHVQKLPGREEECKRGEDTGCAT